MNSPSTKVYTVSTVLFHKYRGENVAVTNYMSHFSMFVPTKATVKLDNGNMVHSQGIGIILYSFPNHLIIYPAGPVYYYPGNPPNTISLGALRLDVDYNFFTYESIEHYDFVDPQCSCWRTTHENQKIGLSSN